MEILVNPLKGRGLPALEGLAPGEVQTDASAALALYGRCPARHSTPLLSMDTLAKSAGIANLWLKMESERMGLGSFKALGAAYAIAKAAAKKVPATDSRAMEQALAGETFVCASAGNHGLSVAAGARLFGAEAVVVLSETVPEGFAERLREKGAKVVRGGRDYEASMELSRQLACDRGWNLLSDGSWCGYWEPARDVMEGYLIMGEEVADQLPHAPSHVFLQAGVGGLAAACTATARNHWGDNVVIVVVEPDAAPALMESVKAGKCVDTTGPVSSMGRLDCKTPSHLALKYLAREADYFLTIGDKMVEDCVTRLTRYEVETSPSGAAGIAALLNVPEGRSIGLNEDSRVVCFVSEGVA